MQRHGERPRQVLRETHLLIGGRFAGKLVHVPPSKPKKQPPVPCLKGGGVAAFRRNLRELMEDAVAAPLTAGLKWSLPGPDPRPPTKVMRTVAECLPQRPKVRIVAECARCRREGTVACHHPVAEPASVPGDCVECVKLLQAALLQLVAARSNGGPRTCVMRGPVGATLLPAALARVADQMVAHRRTQEQQLRRVESALALGHLARLPDVGVVLLPDLVRTGLVKAEGRPVDSIADAGSELARIEKIRSAKRPRQPSSNAYVKLLEIKAFLARRRAKCRECRLLGRLVEAIATDRPAADAVRGILKLVVADMLSRPDAGARDELERVRAELARRCEQDDERSRALCQKLLDVAEHIAERHERADKCAETANRIDERLQQGIGASRDAVECAADLRQLAAVLPPDVPAEISDIVMAGPVPSPLAWWMADSDLPVDIIEHGLALARLAVASWRPSRDILDLPVFLVVLASFLDAPQRPEARARAVAVLLESWISSVAFRRPGRKSDESSRGARLLATASKLWFDLASRADNLTDAELLSARQKIWSLIRDTHDRLFKVRHGKGGRPRATKDFLVFAEQEALRHAIEAAVRVVAESRNLDLGLQQGAKIVRASMTRFYHVFGKAFFDEVAKDGLAGWTRDLPHLPVRPESGEAWWPSGLLLALWFDRVCMRFVAPLLVAMRATLEQIVELDEEILRPLAVCVGSVKPKTVAKLAELCGIDPRTARDRRKAHAIVVYHPFLERALRFDLAKLWSRVSSDRDPRARALAEILEHVPRFQKEAVSDDVLSPTYVAYGLVALLHGMRLDAVRDLATRLRPDVPRPEGTAAGTAAGTEAPASPSKVGLADVAPTGPPSPPPHTT